MYGRENMPQMAENAPGLSCTNARHCSETNGGLELVVDQVASRLETETPMVLLRATWPGEANSS